MVFLPNQHSAASTSFAAVLFLSFAGFFMLLAIGPQHTTTHSVNAFQMHNRRILSRERRRRSRIAVPAAAATRRDDGITWRRSSRCCCPQHQKTTTNTILKNNHHKNIDIARVWANSLEHKIPWHASSREYLSDGLPSLSDDEKEPNVSVSAPP